MLENRYIRLALDEAVRARPGIRLLAPVSVAEFATDQTGVDVRLADGRGVRARLLIGADGRNSTVRARAGIRTIGRAYPVTAIVCTVAHEAPHGGVAHEFFLPAGPFAILPLTQNRANVVWMEAHAVAQTLLAMPQPDFLAELRRRFGDFLGEVTLEGPRFGYPLSLQMAERMIGPRLALVGDAAHGVHPIAGQGLNLGLKDVAALADVLAEAVSRGLDPGDREVLGAYQAWRRFDNAAMAIATDFFDRFFSNDFTPVRLLRGAGLALVNRIGPARRFFMRYAGGGAGRLPRLMQG
jgi:2-octaprenyl-6-methoxyphenol hydroxylase